ncbi:3-hydroxyacyl-ACP dehydratase [Streptomyces sp. NPDC050161]|uniref:3-hydroxyacyl-ACP dehydratase n=1 Tax=Streptomyces sp. NPDC050161 TaxID=3365604 RepID=UPI0037A6CB8C
MAEFTDTGDDHDVLSFNGLPLYHVPTGKTPTEEEGPPAAPPTPVPRARAHPTAPAAADDDPGTLARRTARQLQQAHDAVLDAHRAVSLWQQRNIAHLAVPEHPAGQLPPPAPPAPPLPASRRGVVWSLLGTAFAALPPTGRCRYDVTWHTVVTTVPDGLRTDTVPGAPTCRLHDGDRLLATVTACAQAPGEPEDDRSAARYRPDFRPLARTPVSTLSAADLDAMASGDAAAVLGNGHDQSHLPPELRLEPWPDRLVEEVRAIDPTGGPHGQGLLTATLRPAGPDGPVAAHLLAAACEALRAQALHRGMHLCLPTARTVPAPGATVGVEIADPDALRGTPTQLTLVVRELGMSPRPFLTADCVVTAPDRRGVARLNGLSLAVYGHPHDHAMLRLGQPPVRLASTAEPAFVNELHMARIADGDLGQSLSVVNGPPVRSMVRPRLPRGDLLMVDRCVTVEHGDRVTGAGTRADTEYDMPGDPWYIREAGGDELPQLALMEMALQPTGLVAAVLGLATKYPDEPFVCRNLEGRARLSRRTDPRGATVGQRVRLRSATDHPGALMHRYDFELHADGQPFYTGETVHGYFTEDVLARQQGLDHGHHRAPWLELQDTAPADALRFDAREEPRLGRGRLALLEDTIVVPKGGTHGKGYVLCTKPVRADDWFFDHHFLHDPVMPGSTGVQLLYQAVQALALRTGLTDHLPGARFRAAVGEELRWSYRGQILREHQRVRGEIHLSEVQRERDQVFLRADGSVWRDDLRIYHVQNIAVVAAAPAAEEVRP